MDGGDRRLDYAEQDFWKFLKPLIYHQCCVSGMIYGIPDPDPALNFQSSESRQKFRIHADPDLTYSIF